MSVFILRGDVRRDERRNIRFLVAFHSRVARSPVYKINLTLDLGFHHERFLSLKSNHHTKYRQASTNVRSISGQTETIVFPKPPFAEVGAIFRRARLNLGWSQEKFAEKSIVSVGTVRAAEAGWRLFARSHKALLDAINDARATNRPPQLPLTLPFPEKDDDWFLEAANIPHEDSRATPHLKPRPEPSPVSEDHKSTAMRIIKFEGCTLPAVFPSAQKSPEAPLIVSWNSELGVTRLGNEVCSVKHSSEGTVERQFLTLAEAAAMIGCTRRFLENRIGDGDLKVFKPSTRLVRIRKADLEKWIELYSFGGKARD